MNKSQTPFALLVLCLSVVATAEEGRFQQSLALDNGSYLVIAEGEREPRSIGSYSLRLYSGRNPRFPYDDFLTGLILPREGYIEAIQVIPPSDPKLPPSDPKGSEGGSLGSEGGGAEVGSSRPKGSEGGVLGSEGGGAEGGLLGSGLLGSERSGVPGGPLASAQPCVPGTSTEHKSTQPDHCIAIIQRSVGTGAYLAGDLLCINEGHLSLRAHISGLPPDADVIAAMRRQ